MVTPVGCIHPSPSYTHRLLTPVACLWRPQAGPPMITPLACLHPSPSHSRRMLKDAEGRSAHDYSRRLLPPIPCQHPLRAHTHPRSLLRVVECRSATDHTHRLLIPIAPTARWLSGRTGSSVSWVKRVLGRAHPASSASWASGRQSVRPGTSTS